MRRLLPGATLGFAFVAVGLAVAQPQSGVTHPAGIAKLPLAQQGAQLYAANCSSCHGIDGRGVKQPPQHGIGNVKGQGPSLRGVGAQAADFYLRTGYMPLRTPDQQPYRSRVLFSERELRAMTAYIASLGHGPPIPIPHPAAGKLS